MSAIRRGTEVPRRHRDTGGTRRFHRDGHDAQDGRAAVAVAIPSILSIPVNKLRDPSVSLCLRGTSGRFRLAAGALTLLSMWAAGAALAAEFPLRYTLSPGGPPFFTRGQRLLASDTPMEPVKLPPLHSRKPLFLTARLGDGPDPTFTFVLDESTPGAGYDRLYADTSHTRDLTAIAPLRIAEVGPGGLATGGRGFKPIPLLIDVEGHRVLYHAAIRQFGEGRAADYLLSSWGCYSGEAAFGSHSHTVLVIDADANGRFSDVFKGEDLGNGEGDLFIIDPGESTGFPPDPLLGRESRPIYARRLQVDGHWYDVAVRADGSGISVTPASVPLVTLRSECPRFALLLSSDQGLLTVHGERGAAQLPAGDYRLMAWGIEQSDRRGNLWALQASGYENATAQPRLAVRKDRALPRLGSLVAKATVTPGGGRREFEINLTLSSAGGAAIRSITMNGQPHPEGRVRIVDARGWEIAHVMAPYGSPGFSGTFYRPASNGLWTAPAGVHGKLRAVPALDIGPFGVTMQPVSFEVP
jgi:hypothetical protein